MDIFCASGTLNEQLICASGTLNEQLICASGILNEQVICASGTLNEQLIIRKKGGNYSSVFRNCFFFSGLYMLQEQDMFDILH